MAEARSPFGASKQYLAAVDRAGLRLHSEGRSSW